LSTQVLTTRANGPPGQQRGEDRARCAKGTHTGTALRKPDDRVLSAAVVEVRTALGLINTDEANVLGVC